MKDKFFQRSNNAAQVYAEVSLWSDNGLEKLRKIESLELF